MSVMIIARMISVFAIRPKRYNDVVAKYRNYPVFSRVDQSAPRLVEGVVIKVIVFENIQNDIETDKLLQCLKWECHLFYS